MTLKYREGDVVEMNRLHDSKRPLRVSVPDKNGDHVYAVEGKARPCLVVGIRHRLWIETAWNTNEPWGDNGCHVYNVKGRPGYLVLALQSNPPPGDVPQCFFNDLLKPGKVSYVDLRAFCYPIEAIVVPDREDDRERDRDWPTSIPIRVLDRIRGEMNSFRLGYPQWYHA